MSFGMHALLVFLSVGAVDVVWVFYNQASQHSHRALTAGIASAFIILLGGFNMISYVEDPRLVAPAAAAAFIATFLTVKFKRNS